MHKYVELIREIYEDKKLTAFLKKRTKEYEHKTSGLSGLEAVQLYKDEIEVSPFILNLIENYMLYYHVCQNIDLRKRLHFEISIQRMHYL